MKIKDIITEKSRPSLSFEVFPPNSSSKVESITNAAMSIASLKPSFMSVTYGAGRGSTEFTESIASNIQKSGISALMHLTCVGAYEQNITELLKRFKTEKIENILALRGDIPDGSSPSDYSHASDLIRLIKSNGDFCVGGACYPEGHPESASLYDDLEYLRLKEDCGCDFLTSQMFFDNNIFYNFMYKLRDAGISLPVVAGIMPVTNPSQINRICKLTGMCIPPKFRQIVDRYGKNPDAMKQAGIAYATEQIIDLYANGVNAVHVYSMNKDDIAGKIVQNLSYIIG